MKKWTMPLAAALAALLLTAAYAAEVVDGADLHGRLAKLLHGGKEQSVAERLDAAAETLDLSDAQRKEVAAVLSAALPGLEARALAVIEAHQAQIELVHAAALDEPALRAASAKAGAAQGELVVSLARLMRDVHALLTPEQLHRLAHLHPHGGLLERLAQHVRAQSSDARAWAERQ